MAYFYSERGARIFLILVFVLVGWLFSAISWAAIGSQGRVPEDPGWIISNLSLTGENASEFRLTAEEKLRACALKRSN
ncbi:MAG: hypothetical protein GX564_13210 [Oligosphaeraceae bacterium]|nr:hypothetical protein [Oligosphaeraceae bacterium]